MDKQRVPEVEKDYLLASTIFHFIRTFLLPIYSTSPFSWDMSDRALHGVFFPLLRLCCSLKPTVPLWATTATSRTAQWMSPRRISPQRRSCFEMRAASFPRSRKRPGSPFSAKCDSIILAHSQYSASYCELKTLFIAAQRYDGVNSEEAIAYVRALTDLLLVCAPVL